MTWIIRILVLSLFVCGFVSLHLSRAIVAGGGAEEAAQWSWVASGALFALFILMVTDGFLNWKSSAIQRTYSMALLAKNTKGIQPDGYVFCKEDQGGKLSALWETSGDNEAEIRKDIAGTEAGSGGVDAGWNALMADFKYTPIYLGPTVHALVGRTTPLPPSSRGVSVSHFKDGSAVVKISFTDLQSSLGWVSGITGTKLQDSPSSV